MDVHMNNMEMENNLKAIVYLTVNTVNQKIYVGVHKTENLRLSQAERELKEKERDYKIC